MGNVACCQKSAKTFEGSKRIDCSGRIDENYFQDTIRTGVSENDRRVLRGGMTLLGEHPSRVWKNAEVRCIGDDIDCTFWSGSCTNKFVVFFDDKGEVKQQTKTLNVEPDFQRFDCSGHIDQRDIQDKIRTGVSEKDKRVLRGGMTLLGEHPSRIWKNAEVRCTGDDIDYTFCSGSCTNKAMVYFDDKGEVKQNIKILSFEPDVQRVECSGHIDESDIQDKIRTGVSEKDKRVLRSGIDLLGEHPSRVWKNAEVRCIGDDIDYTFCSGSCTNKAMVYFDDKGEVKQNIKILSFEPDVQRVECSGHIDESDIQDKIRTGVSEKDKRVLRSGIDLLGEHPSRVWKNAEVRCIGDDIDYTFCSGSCTNKAMVYFDDKGEVKQNIKILSFEPDVQRVECSEHIDESDIQDKIRTGVSEKDKRVLRSGIDLLGEHPSRVWKNAEVRCIGDDIDYTFCSGSCTNKAMLYFDDKGEVKQNIKILSFEPDVQRVECSGQIDESDIQTIIRRVVSENDRRVLRGGMTLLTKRPAWVWKDAEVRCVCDNMDYVFFSGRCTNKFLVSSDDNEEVKQRTTEEGWWLWGYNVSASVSEWLPRIAFFSLNKAQSLKAIKDGIFGDTKEG